jgi:hypothetical protein
MLLEYFNKIFGTESPQVRCKILSQFQTFFERTFSSIPIFTGKKSSSLTLQTRQSLRIPFTDKIDILDLNGMIKVMDFIFNFILKIKN